MSSATQLAEKLREADAVLILTSNGLDIAEGYKQYLC